MAPGKPSAYIFRPTRLRSSKACLTSAGAPPRKRCVAAVAVSVGPESIVVALLWLPGTHRPWRWFGIGWLWAGLAG